MILRLFPSRQGIIFESLAVVAKRLSPGYPDEDEYLKSQQFIEQIIKSIFLFSNAHWSPIPEVMLLPVPEQLIFGFYYCALRSRFSSSAMLVATFPAFKMPLLLFYLLFSLSMRIII